MLYYTSGLPSRRGSRATWPGVLKADDPQGAGNGPGAARSAAGGAGGSALRVALTKIIASKVRIVYPHLILHNICYFTNLGNSTVYISGSSHRVFLYSLVLFPKGFVKELPRVQTKRFQNLPMVSRCPKVLKVSKSPRLIPRSCHIQQPLGLFRILCLCKPFEAFRIRCLCKPLGLVRPLATLATL